jgi:hypothetical protein
MMLRAATRCSTPKAAKAAATNAGPTPASLPDLKDSSFQVVVSPIPRKTIPARDGHRTAGEVTEPSFYEKRDLARSAYLAWFASADSTRREPYPRAQPPGDPQGAKPRKGRIPISLHREAPSLDPLPPRGSPGSDPGFRRGRPFCIQTCWLPTAILHLTAGRLSTPPRKYSPAVALPAPLETYHLPTDSPDEAYCFSSVSPRLHVKEPAN